MILMLDVNRDTWQSLPGPSPWICGMLAVFPAALPAVLPGLLVSPGCQVAVRATSDHDAEGVAKGRSPKHCGTITWSTSQPLVPSRLATSRRQMWKAPRRNARS